MQGLRTGSRIFRRLFLSYAAALAIAAAITHVLVVGRQERALLAQTERALVDATHLVERAVAPRLAAGDLAGVKRDLERIKEATGYRTTLVDADGTVRADSDESATRMDDHRSRPEIVAAREAPHGTARRESRTVGSSLLYVARRVDLPGVAYVRVALSLAAVEQSRRGARAGVWVGTLAGLGAALVLGLVVARRTSGPVEEITAVADELRRGNYGARAAVDGDDEIGRLGATLNRLAREVAERLAHMQREDARLRAMLAGMVEGVLAVDREDRVSFVNRAGRDLLGLDDREVAGAPLWEVVRLAGLEELLAGARASGAVAAAEIGARGASERVLEAHASPIQVQDDAEAGAGGLVIVLHDVTDLRRLERVRRDFVANVSHELKTPLTAIKGFVETLLEGAKDDPAVCERFLLRVDDNVDRLSHLVTDLLSLARVEGQGDAIQRAPVDLGAVVAGVATRAQGSAQRKGVELAVETSGGPLIVLGDAEGLTQVANNLIENAINYTPAPGQVRVCVERRGRRGVLVVQDTGVGIPREDLQRIFERFYRVDKARSRAMGGTGLGLSIVRNLVQAMHGEVRVTSELGRGSTFTVEIPLA